MLNISFSSKDFGDHPAIAVLVTDKLQIDSEIMVLDQQFDGLISKAMQEENLFQGKLGQQHLLTTTDKHGALKRILLIGLGDESKLTQYNLEEAGAKIQKMASTLKIDSIITKVYSDFGEFKAEQVSALLASGAMLSSYRFDKYRTKLTEKDKKCCKEFHVICDDEDQVFKLFEEKKAVALGVFFARDLISELPNILYPESYAERVVENLESIGVEVEVLGERQMHDLGMGALLGVGQGSARESKMVIMKYNGADDSDAKPVCFVGKGVTFDTGGISLKPSLNMHKMKYDMGGSAAVVGTMKALALRGAKVNAVGVVGLVENMPGSNAQRPGDVVTTMSGQTVEVLNTDAEGRLVLADCLTYLQKNFKPECIVDLATLTGAIVIALSSTYAGCFSPSNELADNLLKSGDNSGELLWRLPMHEDFDKTINSEVADINNIGAPRGAAGSSTAAHFLGRFVDKDIKWAHLDIAGVAWEESANKAANPRGAVGFGVRLLSQFVADHYENK